MNEHVYPVAVGATGGSGTRVVSKLLQQAGYFFGDYQNLALDCLWYTLLFSNSKSFDFSDEQFQARARYFITALSSRSRSRLSVEQFQNIIAQTAPFIKNSERFESACSSLEKRLFEMDHNKKQWGWKEPNTHFLADRFLTLEPDLKYIHVIRNGYDMVFSKNQRQFNNWSHKISNLDGRDDPNARLLFWLDCHDRIRALRKGLPNRVLFLRFEELCDKTDETIEKLFAFLNLSASFEEKMKAASWVRPPSTISRAKKYPHSIWDHDLVERMAQWNYHLG